MYDYNDDIVRIHRDCVTCRLGRAYSPHAWEWINPATSQPYRRGRVVFMCSMRVARRPPRLSDRRAGPPDGAAPRSAELEVKVPAAHPIP